MSTKKSPPPSILLARALALLGPRGSRWIKGRLSLSKGEQKLSPITGKVKTYPDGAYCMLGCLNKVNTAREAEAKTYLIRAIADNNANRPEPTKITRFNDGPHRKWSDIRAVFKKAIKLAKAEGN